ncbi:hypothetical protein Tco_1479017, partial [Tanacetum coccineum]
VTDCLDLEDILSGIRRFLRYCEHKSNGEYLRKCIFDGPYLPTNVLIAAVEAAENILPVAAHEEVETIHNMTAENKLYFQAEKEAIFLDLTGIGGCNVSNVDDANNKGDVDSPLKGCELVRLGSGLFILNTRRVVKRSSGLIILWSLITPGFIN